MADIWAHIDQHGDRIVLDDNPPNKGPARLLFADTDDPEACAYVNLDWDALVRLYNAVGAKLAGREGEPTPEPARATDADWAQVRDDIRAMRDSMTEVAKTLARAEAREELSRTVAVVVDGDSLVQGVASEGDVCSCGHLRGRHSKRNGCHQFHVNGGVCRCWTFTLATADDSPVPPLGSVISRDAAGNVVSVDAPDCVCGHGWDLHSGIRAHPCNAFRRISEGPLNPCQCDRYRLPDRS